MTRVLDSQTVRETTRAVRSQVQLDILIHESGLDGSFNGAKEQYRTSE